MKMSHLGSLSTTALALALSTGATATNSVTLADGGVRSPRLQTAANPDAAKKSCSPCQAKVKTCNPCGAKNPCNPCMAGGAATDCVVPRLAVRYLSSNPCAAKNPCSPCGPRSADARQKPPELTDAEMVKAYGCVLLPMLAAYRKSGHPTARAYSGWTRFSKISYPTEAHGVRFMNNYTNPAAKAAYGKWEGVGSMPAGSVIAKDSFIVAKDGKISVGPLFLMTKQYQGWNKGSRDWLYTMITAAGKIRTDAAMQKFCNDCHRRAGAVDDYLMFLPLPFRISNTN